MNGRRSGRSGNQPHRAFTLIELLMVIVIIGILLALLLPVIGYARRTANDAAVTAEINALAQALEGFKSKYGDYPPSRILLSENGYWPTADTTPLASLAPGTSAGETDILLGQLAQRSVAHVRKFWPKLATSTNGLAPIFPTGSTAWYDFNGDGVFASAPYILQGHECLTFFLGGVPGLDGAGNPVTFTGFSRNPANPFMNTIMPTPSAPNPMYNGNRQQPLFEFPAGRLAPSPGSSSGIPGYYDSLGTRRFIAYFSAYGGGQYDPNDCNLDNVNPETDGTVTPAGSSIALGFLTTFPVYDGSGTKQAPGVAVSAPPNPYTATATTGTVPVYLKPNSFQLLSAGADGEYGIGGVYGSSSDRVPLPPPGTAANSTDADLRIREHDNLANFKAGRLN